MSYKTEPIKRKYENGPMDGVRDSHPCFATAGFHKVSGGHPLFGSVVNHEHGHVSFTVHQCERYHSYSTDKYFNKGAPLIEIAMTESQFANLMTNWNMGEGTPVTLKHITDGDRRVSVPQLPVEHESEAVRAEVEFKEKLKQTHVKFEESKRELLEILDKKGAINKKDRNQIRGIVTTLERWFKDSAPYSVHTFVECADRTVSKAKVEIESFVTRLIHKTGLDHLKSMGKLTGFSGEKELQAGEKEDA